MFLTRCTVVLSLVASCAMAGGTDCGALKLAASTPMEIGSSGRPIVTVRINDTPRRFVFDSAGMVAQIAPAVADELKLRRHDSPIKLLDVSGHATAKMVVVDDFALGPLKGRKLQLQVATRAPSDGDGLLTPSLFPRFDIDLDFGAGRMSFLSQDHCDGHVVYWRPEVVAVVPMIADELKIIVPITVDGHALRAVIDTGSNGTFMDMDVARHVFGLAPDSPDMEAAGYANGDQELPVYRHVFGNVSFEGVHIARAVVLVMASRTGSKDKDNPLLTGSRARRADDDIDDAPIILGMDVLRKLHIYIAFKERKLYISAAGTSQATSQAATGTE
jgi:Aspartyl protease